MVLGDVMLDVRANLSGDRFDEAIAGESVAAGQIAVTAAGSGPNLARALGRHFDSVVLLGAVGQDPAARLLVDLLDKEPFASVITETEGRSGTALVLRDAAGPDAPHGQRIVVADRAANDELATADVTRRFDLIREADLACVDGYGLLHEPRRGATRNFMALARDAGTEVFCDLVPHDLHHYATVDQCRQWLADATIVGTSALTLACLFERPMPEKDDDGAMAGLAELASAVLGVRTLLVRYGYGHCSRSLAYRQDHGALWCEPTAYPDQPADQVAAYGDTLTADELHRLVGAGV